MVIKNIWLRVPWQWKMRWREWRGQYPKVAKNFHERTVSVINGQLTSMRQENEALRRKMDEVLPKLVRVAIQFDARPHEAYRLILDMSPMLIREAFEWGNDDYAIRAFAERVGHMVYRELKTANMQRFSERPYFYDSRMTGWSKLHTRIQP